MLSVPCQPSQLQPDPQAFRGGSLLVQVVMWVLALQRLGGGAQFHSHQLSWGPWGASPRRRCSVLCLASTLPTGDQGEMEGSGFPFRFLG